MRLGKHHENVLESDQWPYQARFISLVSSLLPCYQSPFWGIVSNCLCSYNLFMKIITREHKSQSEKMYALNNLIKG